MYVQFIQTISQNEVLYGEQDEEYIWKKTKITKRN